MKRVATPAQRRQYFYRLALVLCPVLLVAGMVSGYAAGNGGANRWFSLLEKPALYPPTIVFPVVWTALYLLMAVALALVIAAPRSRWQRLAVLIFAAQFALNLAWSPVFFGSHRIAGGLGIILLLDLALIATIVLFARLRMLASWLLALYLVWTLFATGLNWQILRDNPHLDGARMHDVEIMASR